MGAGSTATRLAVAWASGNTIPAPEAPRSRPWLIAAAIVVAPAVFVPLMVIDGGPLLDVPRQHFYIVSGVSLGAALVAGILAVTTVQIGLYRVLFLCLGFMSMGAIFAVHGLTTPGILVPRAGGEYGGAVVVSGFISLFVPAIFFAAAYAPGMAWLERRLPFWPAGWLVVVTAVGLASYGALAIIGSRLFAHTLLTTAAFRTGLTIATIGLLVFSALRQARLYRLVHLSSQASLIFAYILLADAAAAMVLFDSWTLGWWYYHLLMLVAVVFALRSLVYEKALGRSFRDVVEAALELGVSVETEEFDVETVAALVAAVEVKDHETRGHNHRVAELCVQIAHAMGMNAGQLRVMARSGLLHDVGKLGIPDSILHKPGPLDEAEWAVMKTHPEVGLTILHRTGHFNRELLGVLHHHERMDGSGYPHGLAGEAIPMEARIVAVADTYDVLTSDRPYRRARSRAEARLVVEQEAGTHLDRAVVVALLRTLDESLAIRAVTPEGSPARPVAGHLAG